MPATTSPTDPLIAPIAAPVAGAVGDVAAPDEELGVGVEEPPPAAVTVIDPCIAA